MNTLVLPVVLPLLAAPLIVLIGGRERAWYAALLSVAACLWSVLHVFSLGDGHTSLGGWEAPVGIVYALDGANRPILLLIMVAALLSLLTASPARLSHLKGMRLSLFYALFLLCICGLAGIAGTGDAFNVFVFLEVSSLATYALVASGAPRQALRAAFQYLVLGTLGGSFVLLGIGFFYMATGSLNMADIAARLPSSVLPNAVMVGAAFLLFGFMLKSALFPLHQWLPGVYAQSPIAVSSFLAATGTKVSLYALARFSFAVLGVNWLAAHRVDAILLILACAGMLFGSLAAIQQVRLKLLLAWSSVAQIAYIVLGMSLLNQDGLYAAYLVLLIHAFIKGGLFLACGALASDTLSDLRGLGARDPVTALCLSIGALSLLGIPLTAGFVGKWTLLHAIWAHGPLLAVLVFAASSLLAVVYVGRIVLPLWQTAPDDQTAAPVTPVPLNIRVAMLTTATASLVFGVWPQPLMDLSLPAAQALLAP